MSWTNADTRLCRLFNYSYGKRFTRIARDNPESDFEISEDLCCTTISSIFKISIDDNKMWKLTDLRKKIDVLLGKCSKLTSMEIVNLLHPILEQICICLRSKLNHNNHRYRSKQHILYQGNTAGDFEHDVFFYDICNELYRVYKTYNLSLKTYNSMMKTDKRLSNLIEENYPDILNNCYLKNQEKVDGNILTSKNKIYTTLKANQSKTFRKKRSGVKNNYRPKK